ncbi:DUF1302 family protein [Pseudomonas sp.]|uniref:DUF1302 domain-containing protein n=1 Tax=Pseudomonas sp. TaxID=306 RepID=UPI00262E21F7|nr:DUF1302 family protein [Pseudomonas sp.]
MSCKHFVMLAISHHPRFKNGRQLAHLVMACTAAMTWTGASAFEIPTDNPDWKVRWDTSLKYSTAMRLKGADSKLTGPAQANFDDGDRNFRDTGLVSNRMDLFTEADAIYKERFGARVSGAAWYDDVYNRSNDNNSPATLNSSSARSGEFTTATRDLMGRKAELLDAFVFGGADFDDMTGTFRLGRHAQVWGETLFFGSNGIAGGMGPIDYVKLFNVPGSQFKEVVMPVNQISGQLQIRPGLTVSGYYQLEWEENRIPASGSFSSFSDIFGDGTENLLWSSGSHFTNAGKIKPSNMGQFGFQVRIRPENIDAEFGLYAIRYHQKDGNIYIRPTAGTAFFSNPGAPGESVGVFQTAYQEGIRAYGASVSTTIGDANVGLEASFRDNAPLVNGGTFVFDPSADNNSHPAYPVGRTAHVNVSSVVLLSPGSLWEGGTLLAEMGWNRTVSVTENPQALDPNSTRDALGFRMLFSPTYYQVMNGLDVSVPIGLGYNPKGRSSAVSLFNGGVDKGGDYSIGVKGEYHKNLTLGLTYTSYFGDTGAVLAPTNDRLSFNQYYKDRSNIAATVQMSF